MRRLRALLVRLAAVAGFGRHDQEIDEELLAHRELLEAEYQRAGLDPIEARRRAGIDFGSVAAVAEAYRDRRGLRFLEQCFRDSVYAVRSLRRSPGLVLSTLLVLGLGIGVSTAIATVFHSVVWQELPLRDPEQVVKLSLSFEGKFSRHVSGAHSGFSYPELNAYRDASRALDGLAGVDGEKVTWQNETATESLRAALVSGDYFRVLRAVPARGRLLTTDDSRQPLAVISHRFWRESLGGREDAIGHALVLDRVAYVVVGIAEERFTGTDVTPIDVWLPLEAATVLRSNGRALAEENFSWLEAVGRLAPDMTLDAAAAESALIGRAFDRDSPGRRTTVQIERASRLPAGMWVSSDKRVLLGAGAAVGTLVGVLLLICGSNVAALLLSRGASRHKEIAVRVALGASRRRITQQLFTEVLILAAASALVGVLVCTWAFHLVAVWLPIGDLVGTLAPNGRVFVVAFASALGIAIVFGLVPLRQVAGADCLVALKGDGAQSLTRLPAMRLRRSLISIQVAVSLILLVAAGLLSRSLGRALTVDPGYPTSGLYLVEFDRATAEGTGSPARGSSLVREMRNAVADQPGVVEAGLGSIGPFRGIGTSTVRTATMNDPVLVRHNAVDTRYFRTLGVPLVTGRFPDPKEADTVIVNDSLARRFWGDERNAVGQLMEIPGRGLTAPRSVRVVGVIKTVQTTDIGLPDEPTYYRPLVDADTPHVMVVRATVHAPAVRLIVDAVRALDPAALVTIRSLDEQLAIATIPSRVGATLAGFLGILAVLVAAVGLHGIVAHSVVARTREIGIRLALGAPPAAVLRLVVGSSLRSVWIGALVGGAMITVVALSLATSIRSALFGLNPMDPIAGLAAAACLGTIVFVAVYVPARRALGIAPLRALGHDL